MANLSNFAELMHKAAEDKKIRLQEEQKKREDEFVPLLSELFSSVISAKKASQLTAIKEAPLLAELHNVLNNPTPTEKLSIDAAELIEQIEVQAEDIKNTPKETTTDSEKRFLVIFNKLQADFQTLKKYVENKSQSISYGGTSGSGEVRILRMDDIEKSITPIEGDTLVWSSTLNKFVLKQQNTNIGSPTSDEEMPYTKRVDFVTDNEIYKGEAAVGSLVTTSVWRIRKIVISNDGDVSETWADGNSNYDNSWTNRSTYSYS